MDYTTQKLSFQVRKALRYIRLYGIQRTVIKVKGQYHMKKRYARLPSQGSPPEEGGHVGLIGSGNYSFGVIAYYLKRNFGSVLRGAMDIDIHKAASLYEQFGLRYYTDDAEEIISDPGIDLIYIASNHASHAEYAIRALRAGKSVHIEKPHVVRAEHLEHLCSAMAECPGKVGLGFNRPYSRIGQVIKQTLDSQKGAAMYNWHVVGHDIPPDHWYAKEEEGGRVFGNLCHWTDFVLQLVARQDRYPLTINPTRGQRSDCDIAVTYTFGDESIAAITFSAKGHTFEGVRERFAGQRGNVLISMDDFRDLTVEIIEKKHRISPFFRDHGHEQNILCSYAMVRPPGGKAAKGCSIEDVWETGNLFLKTRDALEADRKIVIHGYESGA